jgi:hypothetical protein
MRKKATIKLEIEEKVETKDGLAIKSMVEDITIYEVNVESLLQIWDEFKSLDRAAPDWRGVVHKWLPEFITIPYAKLVKLYPSEIRQIKEKFWEVNKDFFETLEWIGMKKAMEMFQQKVQEDLRKSLRGLSAPATSA